MDGSPTQWNRTSGSTPLATNTSTKVIDAGAAAVAHRITDLEIINVHATVGTVVSILDDTTELWSMYLPPMTATNAAVLVDAHFSTPLRGSAATQLNIKATTTGAAIYWNAQGYTEKVYG
jgi:hypothetical protein